MSDYQTWVWEVMGRDRHGLVCKRLAERDSALRDCRNDYERDQCKDAYRKLIREEVDALQQSRGFQSEVFHKQQITTDLR